MIVRVFAFLLLALGISAFPRRNNELREDPAGYIDCTDKWVSFELLRSEIVREVNALDGSTDPVEILSVVLLQNKPTLEKPGCPLSAYPEGWSPNQWVASINVRNTTCDFHLEGNVYSITAHVEYTRANDDVGITHKQVLTTRTCTMHTEGDVIHYPQYANQMNLNGQSGQNDRPAPPFRAQIESYNETFGSLPEMVQVFKISLVTNPDALGQYRISRSFCTAQLRENSFGVPYHFLNDQGCPDNQFVALEDGTSEDRLAVKFVAFEFQDRPDALIDLSCDYYLCDVNTGTAECENLAECGSPNRGRQMISMSSTRAPVQLKVTFPMARMYARPVVRIDANGDVTSVGPNAEGSSSTASTSTQSFTSSTASTSTSASTSQSSSSITSTVSTIIVPDVTSSTAPETSSPANPGSSTTPHTTTLVSYVECPILKLESNTYSNITFIADKDGELLSTNNMGPHKQGTKVQFKCTENKGRLSGDSVMECGGDSTWLGKQLVCSSCQFGVSLLLLCATVVFRYFV